MQIYSDEKEINILRICFTFYGDYRDTAKTGGWGTRPLIYQ